MMSGYDLSRFVHLTQSEKNEMLCSICLAIFRRPVDTICGHTFCFDCINDWFNSYSDSCPQCRNNLRPIFSYSLPFVESTKRFRNLIDRLKIRCDFADKGCDHVMDLGLLRKHLETCEFNQSKGNADNVLKWTQMNGTDDLEPEAVVGGYDINGESMYVGRAFQSGHLIVGKILPSRQCCCVCWDGKEFCHQKFEVLTNPGKKCELKWIPSSHGSVPFDAIQGGKQSNGEVLYIGRANHLNSLTIGKVHPSHQVLYIPFGGGEHRYSHYEVLCLKSS